jgi:malate dehydrogenase (oxaloacetate-decarboxylating)(NADP+)
MFLAAARALANSVGDADLARGSVFPPLHRIRTISSAIAVAVAGVAYQRGLAHDPEPADLRASIEAAMYQPQYEQYA